MLQFHYSFLRYFLKKTHLMFPYFYAFALGQHSELKYNTDTKMWAMMNWEELQRIPCGFICMSHTFHK